MTENEKTMGFMFEEAMKLGNAGDLVAARRLLTRLLEQLSPDDKVLLGNAHIQLGRFAKMLGEHGEREPHLRAATSALPASELASVGLFLALYDLGRLTEAFQEMVRFLRRRYSELYDEMPETPEDCAEFVGKVEELIVEARRLLAARRTS
jgi:thioredoxin-like negative regulator of GroEL